MMRWIVLASVLLAGCSKCGRKAVVDDTPPAPWKDIPAYWDPDATPAAALPLPGPTYVAPPEVEMPDGCLDIATDFEWRKAIACSKEPDCTPDALDGGRMGEWNPHDVDLNGDGIKEAIRTYAFGGNGPGDPEVHVYLGGATCATHVTTMSDSFEVLTTRHDGWLDLKVVDGESFCEGIFVCGCRASETYYVHKDDDYVVDPSRTIEGKSGHCPQQGDPCSKNSDCAPMSLVCIAGACAVDPKLQP